MMRTVTGAKEIAAGLPLIRRKTLATSRLFHRRLAAAAA